MGYSPSKSASNMSVHFKTGYLHLQNLKNNSSFSYLNKRGYLQYKYLHYTNQPFQNAIITITQALFLDTVLCRTERKIFLSEEWYNLDELKWYKKLLIDDPNCSPEEEQNTQMESMCDCLTPDIGQIRI